MNINSMRPDEHLFLKRLTSIVKPPKCLYYTGTLPEEYRCVVAIVGTRRPTSYGKTVTEQIASAVASRGGIVVSGMALGVDAIAHKSALDAGGNTVAVLPSGVDNPYPRTNHQLASRITANGALISEYENGHLPHPYDFLHRNRLVCGLADAVVVTEASLRSGTMSTVAHALEQGRPVYAVPGPITSPLSAGCNAMIAQGANPVINIDLLLESLGLAGQSKIVLGENDAETTLLQLLQKGVSDGDDLQLQSGLSAQDFSMTITMLEIRGIIHPLGGNHWRL
ncbi:MAG: DNA-processing protein DprA [Candidatus Saccharimonas sp.]|nr:DNA-processing protein DprA [Candidatus Saccharimonas sp.]